MEARLLPGNGPFERCHRILPTTSQGRIQRDVVFGLLIYVIVWTLYGVLAKGGQDIHFDMAEMVAWSRDAWLGTPKHPPFGAWVVGIWFRFFPLTDWSFYLLAVCSAALTLWFAWRISESYLGEAKGLLGVATLAFVPFFNFHALKFNANSILLPLWALATWTFLRSFENRDPRWAAFAGLAAAAAILGKYWSVMLVTGFAIAAIMDAERRAYFRSSAPWISMLVGAAALAPNLFWLVSNDFAPLRYAHSMHPATLETALRGVAEYLAGAIAYISVPLVVALIISRGDGATVRDMIWPAEAWRRRLGLVFAVPLLLPIPFSLFGGFKLSPMWTMSCWALLPSILLSSSRLNVSCKDALFAARGIAVYSLIILLLAPLVPRLLPRISHEPRRHYRLLARSLSEFWRETTNRPLEIVGGRNGIAYGVSFYAPDRPSAFDVTSPALTPWVTADRIRRSGVALVCADTDIFCFDQAASWGAARPEALKRAIGSADLGLNGQDNYTMIVVPPLDQPNP